jgi:DNA-binding LytR/AlgR family response regulator
MNGPGLTVLAVDDERPPLEDLARILRASPRVSDVDTAMTGRDAIVRAGRKRYDVIFLDVRMPELDGLELAGVLRAFATPPAVVFVSAYDTPAVEAFALRALDYVMKPVTAERIEEALERVAAAGVLAGATTQPAPEPERDVVAVDNLRGGGTRLLVRSSILYLQAHGDYVRIYADSGRFLLRGRLSEIERRWTAHEFVRVHRQYLANLRRAVELRPELNGTAVLVLEDGSEIPVARREVSELRRRLNM